MQITIKKYESKDEEQFAKLISLCFEDKYLLSIVYSNKLKFAYSAFCGDKLIGVTVAWTNSFHPHCTYFRILSNPFYKRSGVEEKLLSTIKEVEIIVCPLQTSIWETSVSLREMYEKNGFDEIRRTYMPTLKVADVKDYLPSYNKKDVIKTLAEVLTNEVLSEKLMRIVKRNYEKTHVVNPVAENEWQDWEKRILSDDVVLDGSYVYLDADEKGILAYSFLHESDTNDTLELGWCGVSDNQNKSLISRLIYDQIRYAIKHNILFILGEFDTTDEYALEVLNSIPFAPCPTWITYRKQGGTRCEIEEK